MSPRVIKQAICRQVFGHDWKPHKWPDGFAPGRIWFVDRVAHDCDRCGAFAYLPRPSRNYR